MVIFECFRSYSIALIELTRAEEGLKTQIVKEKDLLLLLQNLEGQEANSPLKYQILKNVTLEE